ncbi:MAG: discoidin domain-containing protein [Rikenellaceae bacterium]
MKKIFYPVLCATLAFAGCGYDDEPGVYTSIDMADSEIPATGTFVNAYFYATGANAEYKSYYQIGQDSTELTHTWSKDDKLSVFVPGVSSNTNIVFTAGDYGQAALFTGSLATWSGSEAVYAVYPYSADYTLSGTSLSISTTGLTVDAGGASSGMFVGSTADATLISRDSVGISEIAMTQVYSFLRLTLSSANLYEDIIGVTITADKSIFAATATVDLATGAATAATTTDAVSFTIENHSGNSSTFDLPVLPTAAYSGDITVAITAVDTTETPQVTSVYTSTISNVEIATSNAVSCIAYAFESLPTEDLDRSNWSLSASATEESEGALEYIVDGDWSTYWHSTWSDETVSATGQYVTIDLGGEYRLASVWLVPRSYSQNNSGNIYTSNDGSTFTLAREYEIAASQTQQDFPFTKPISGVTHFRVSCEDTYGQLAEVGATVVAE